MWSNLWSKKNFRHNFSVIIIEKPSKIKGFSVSVPKTTNLLHLCPKQLEEYFLNIFRCFLVTFILFRLLFRTFQNRCFRVFHTRKWLFLWSKALRHKGLQEQKWSDFSAKLGNLVGRHHIQNKRTSLPHSSNIDAQKIHRCNQRITVRNLWAR